MSSYDEVHEFIMALATKGEVTVEEVWETSGFAWSRVIEALWDLVDDNWLTYHADGVFRVVRREE